MKYGYSRCSTTETRQDIDRQKRELMLLGVLEEHIYWEYESGAKKNRPELTKLLEVIKPGDSIYTTEVSRLSRSTAHICEILEIVKNKKIKLVIGSFCVDCTGEEIDPMTKGMLLMWAVFAEMERDIIAERVKSGLQNARTKGKRLGRPELTEESIPDEFMRYYVRYINGQLNITEIAKIMGISRATIYRYIKVIEKNKGIE